MIKSLLPAALGLLACAATLPAAAQKGAAKTTMHRAAQAFLATLTSEQKSKALMPFHSEERLNWHYVPKERAGLRLKDMTEPQRAAAMQLLQVSLSQKGLEKAETIRKLEAVLHEMEGNNPIRNPEFYYFAVFGEPTEKGAWGWRYEGHHISMHWTALNGKIIASSPQFFGANPAEVRQGAMKGTRALAAEEDLARALADDLDAAQKSEAVIATKAPDDIITAAARKAAILEDKGLAYSRMNRRQQGMLLALIQEHAASQPAPLARKRLDALRKAGLDKIKFAWMGALERGKGHYYRVQGPTFLIEYDNTQNNANHIHVVWRDFKGDFGADLLEEHYKNSAHHQHDHDE